MTELEHTEYKWHKSLDANRHHREHSWDYCGRGIYHFSLTVIERYPLFGRLEGSSQEEARVVLNPFGKKVLGLLQDEPRFYEKKGYYIKILASQLMPDHIHIAIQVIEPLPKPIGVIIRGFKSACSSLYKRGYWNAGNYADEVQDDMIDILHFSRIFTRTNTIWEPNIAYYHERILHSYEGLKPMIHYIKDNPRRLWLKRANPDLFRLHQQTPIAGVACTTLGNMFLYENPCKAPLHCSRTLTQAEIDALKAECLSNAENGTIYVSPAVSEGEKQVCRALREAGFPLIILLNDGFPTPDSPHYKYYKPKGVYFEACAAGNLLLVEPNPDLFDQPDIEAKVYAKTGEIPHTAKRYRFLALNALADKIGG